MPLTQLHPLSDAPVIGPAPTLGTPTGVRIQIAAPWRGSIQEVGFVPSSTVVSGMTLAVALSDNSPSSTASAFVQFVTSTVGTFSSVNLQEGRVASVQNLFQMCNKGDVIQFTASGGPTSAVGGYCYAIIRRG